MSMKQSGFTLIELLVTLFVSTLVIGAVLVSLIYSVILDEYNEKFSIAMNIARAKLEEEISKRKDFTTIVDRDCGDDGESCLQADVDGIEGSWRIDVTPVYGNELVNVRVVVCWRGRGGRIVGEDTNLNGELDDGEDINPANVLMDSPCVLTTAIARR